MSPASRLLKKISWYSTEHEIVIAQKTKMLINKDFLLSNVLIMLLNLKMPTVNIY